MNTLFDDIKPRKDLPLPAEVRPERLDDIVGHDELIGQNGSLRKRIAAGRLGSVVLYGPTGCGKTTIAAAIGAEMQKDFHHLQATQTKIADLRTLSEMAKTRPTLVLLDEIHRLSVTQQEQLLQPSENGLFDLVMTTTENPFHCLAKGVISRSTIKKLEPLTYQNLFVILANAIDKIAAKRISIEVSEENLRAIAERSNGDARRALTTLETLIIGAKPGDHITITNEMIDTELKSSPIPFDRQGDAHYDIVSAFIKSMRGGCPQGTLFWLGRLIHGGEDPRFIARRILIHASEDVGLADNSALHTAAAALAAVEHIGMPEARINLAHAALHVCLAPKSNSAIRGIDRALAYIDSMPTIPVPNHLRDGHYRGATKLGVGGYEFPHDLPAGWSEQSYVPGLPPGAFYESDARTAATFEKRAALYWEKVSGRKTPARFNPD